MNQNMKVMKTLLITLLLAISLGGMAQDNQNFLNVMAENGLNMRSKPYPNSRVITKVFYGKTVEVLEKTTEELQLGWVNGNWCKVRYRGREGYVFDGYLSSLVPPQEMRTSALSELLTPYCNDNFIAAGEPIETLETSRRGDTLKHTLFTYTNGFELELEQQTDRSSSMLILSASIEETYILLEAMLKQANMKHELDELRFMKGNDHQLSRVTTSDGSVTLATHSEGRSYVKLVSWNEPD